MTDQHTSPTDLTALPLFAQRPAAHRLAGGSPSRATTTPARDTASSGASTPATDDVVVASEPTRNRGTLADSFDDITTASGDLLPATPPQNLTPDDLVGVDWTLVRQLRDELAETLSTGHADTEGRRLNRDQDEQLAWTNIGRVLSIYQSRRLSQGQDPLSSYAATQLGAALLDAIFGMGILERYLHLDGLEDIQARGHDNVWLTYSDGRRERGPAIADSDQQMIADLRHIAASNPTGERPFGPAQPRLDLAIGTQGHRLTGTLYVDRPAMTIRRQGFTDADLNDLVRLGAIDDILAQFLSAAVKAGLSIVVSGLPSAGKTTMIRAILNELDPDVPLATIETEYELALHQMPDRHTNVWAAQYRPGGEDGAGEVTLEKMVRDSLRESVDRIVVGEVRGHEIVAMFDAMQAGKGSVCTIHAGSATETIPRIVACAIKVPPTTPEYAYQQIALNVDLIVHIEVVDETPIGGRKLRFVDEVLALSQQSDAPHGVGREQIFAPGPDGRAVPTGVRPEWIDKLRMQGFDPAWLNRTEGDWATPLPTLSNTRLEEDVS